MRRIAWDAAPLSREHTKAGNDCDDLLTPPMGARFRYLRRSGQYSASGRGCPEGGGVFWEAEFESLPVWGGFRHQGMADSLGVSRCGPDIAQTPESTCYTL